MIGELSDHVHYPYLDPTAVGPRILFWQCRAKVTGDPTRRKTFWYVTANPEFPGRWSMGAKEHPSMLGIDSRPCLYRFPGLRTELRRRSKHAGTVIWAEGEKDALAADVYRLLGISHHGAANKATPEQAEHFRGYTGHVLLPADRDDAGYACAARRYELLRAVGLRSNQLSVVRAADGVLSGGGGCGADVVCRCDVVCPLPSKQHIGADLADHVAAGYRLRDLVPVAPSELRAAADRWAASEQQGAFYGGLKGSPIPPGWTTQEWAALTKQSIASLRRNGSRVRFNTISDE